MTLNHLNGVMADIVPYYNECVILKLTTSNLMNLDPHWCLQQKCSF